MASNIKIGGVVSICNGKLVLTPGVKKKTIQISAPQPLADTAPVMSLSPSTNATGRKTLVIKLAKPPSAVHNSKLFAIKPSTSVPVESNPKRLRGPRQRIEKNPTPSPSPPLSENSSFDHSFRFRPLIRSYTRNPTPPPSPPLPGKNNEVSVTESLKHQISSFPDQLLLPVTSLGTNTESANTNSNDDNNSNHSTDTKSPEMYNIDEALFPNNQTSLTLEDLERFVKSFKQKRVKLGFTQGDVGAAMGKMYGLEFSQTTVSRFEAMNLSFKNMSRLKICLENWLNDTERAVHKGMFEKTLFTAETIQRRRKRRTTIESNLKTVLEGVYEKIPRPTLAEVGTLADELDLDREVVRVWFCNRRQRDRDKRLQNNYSSSVDTSNDELMEQDSIEEHNHRRRPGILIFAQNSSVPHAVEETSSVVQQNYCPPPLMVTNSNQKLIPDDEDNNHSPRSDIVDEQPLDFAENEFLQQRNDDE